MMFAKMDSYDYELVFKKDKLKCIKVYVDGNSDITIADLATDVNVSNGKIYVEGHYVVMDTLEIKEGPDGQWYVQIDVSQEENVND